MRTVVDRPHGVRLGGTMRVHIVRIVRAEMAAPVTGRSGQPRVDSTTNRSSLLVNAGLSCVDEGDLGTGRGLEGEQRAK